MTELKIGTKVVYRPAFGTEAPVTATIIGKGEKRGEPLYDLDNGHWAYAYQIEKVVK